MARKSVVHVVISGKVTMLIYTSLFLASLAVLVVARISYKAISSGYKVVSDSGKSADRFNERLAIAENTPGYQKSGKTHKASTEALSPLNMVSRETAGNSAKTHATTPRNHHNQGSAWLLREEKLAPAAAGKVFKVKRRVTQEPQTLEMVSKPWRRKVAPWIQNPEFVNDDLVIEDAGPASILHEAKR